MSDTSFLNCCRNGHANLADSLSSVEIVLIHQADVLYMQNWEHVQFVLDHTNRMPAATHPDTDFSRVRPYFLDGMLLQRLHSLL